MATKAERFRAEVERSKGPRPKKGAASKKGATRTASSRTGRKASFALEETPPPIPASRKSTRRSKNRQKAAAALKAKQLLKLISPQSRHDQLAGFAVNAPSPRAARR
jgi:hypothetical protein